MTQLENNFYAVVKRRKAIEEDPTYQEVLKDSFGGVMYNVANRDKYSATHLIEKWDAMTKSEQVAAGGIMAGAINFLKGN